MNKLVDYGNTDSEEDAQQPETQKQIQQKNLQPIAEQNQLKRKIDYKQLQNFNPQKQIKKNEENEKSTIKNDDNWDPDNYKTNNIQKDKQKNDINIVNGKITKVLRLSSPKHSKMDQSERVNKKQKNDLTNYNYDPQEKNIYSGELGDIGLQLQQFKGEQLEDDEDQIEANDEVTFFKKNIQNQKQQSEAYQAVQNEQLQELIKQNENKRNQKEQEFKQITSNDLLNLDWQSVYEKKRTINELKEHQLKNFQKVDSSKAKGKQQKNNQLNFLASDAIDKMEEYQANIADQKQNVKRIRARYGF